MTMRRLTTIFSLLFLISCSDQSTDKQSVHKQIIIKDTTSQQANTVDTLMPQITTDRFLRLVEFFDSSGFHFDTPRFKKTYKYSDNAKVHKIDNYIFYDISFEKTIPYEHIKRCDNDTSEHMKNWCAKWGLNLNNFEKAEKIIQYFFVDKNVNSPTYRGEKYFVDGIIEEWKFPDNNSAKRASEDLGTKQEMVYVNRGGFVCYLDNYMYVFHSRASNFMYSLKPLFKTFVTNNKAIKTNKN